MIRLLIAIWTALGVAQAVTSTRLATDGDLHVTWQLLQPRAGPPSNGTDADAFQHVGFCQFGVHNPGNVLPSVTGQRVDKSAVLGQIKACEDFISHQEHFRRPKRHGHRQKREYDFKVIYPRTKWCGTGNIASSYHDLGELRGVDACCRDHDHCPDHIKAGQYRGGVRNSQRFPMFPCWCEEKFRNCLKTVGTMNANTIGVVYFNVLNSPCFVARGRLANGEILKAYRTKPYEACLTRGILSAILGGC